MVGLELVPIAGAGEWRCPMFTSFHSRQLAPVDTEDNVAIKDKQHSDHDQHLHHCKVLQDLSLSSVRDFGHISSVTVYRVGHLG